MQGIKCGSLGEQFIISREDAEGKWFCTLFYNKEIRRVRYAKREEQILFTVQRKVDPIPLECVEEIEDFIQDYGGDRDE